MTVLTAFTSRTSGPDAMDTLNNQLTQVATIRKATLASSASYGAAASVKVWANHNAARYVMNSSPTKVGLILSPDPNLSSFLNHDPLQQPTLTSGVLTFDTTNNPIALYEGRQYTGSSGITLPSNVSGGTVGKGFTCTGLSKFSDGTWLVGNHGWPNETQTPITLAASLVHLSSDFQTVLHEAVGTAITPTYTGSLQGVAIDTDNTIWFCAPQFGKVVHVHSHLSGTFGALIGSFDLALANGITVDTIRNQLIIVTNGVSSTVDKVAKWYAKDGTLQATTLGLGSLDIPDHFHFDATWGTAGMLWVTSGANHTPGRIDAYDLASGTQCYQWLVKECGAIEGIHVERSGGEVTIYLANDGWYHNTYPELNQIFRITSTIDSAMLADTVQIGTMIIRPRAQSAVNNAIFFTMGNVFATGRGISFNLTTTNNAIRTRIKLPELGSATQTKDVDVTPALVSFIAGITSGSPTMTVSTYRWGTLAIGHTVTATGVPAGTTVTAVSGNTITLSANATATNAAVTGTATGITVSPFLMTWELDSVNGTLRLYFNGSDSPTTTVDVIQGISSTIPALTSQINGALAGTKGPNIEYLFTPKVVHMAAYDAINAKKVRQALEGEAVWSAGRADLLTVGDAGHPFAGFPPADFTRA